MGNDLNLRQLAGLLQNDQNTIRVHVRNTAAGAPCGVLIDAIASRGFQQIGSSGRLPGGCRNALCHEEVTFARRDPGDVLMAQQVTTNMAGLATYALSELIMVDDSPPHAPRLRPCSPKGQLINETFMYQSDLLGLQVCWDRRFGFAADNFVDVVSSWQLEEPMGCCSAAADAPPPWSPCCAGIGRMGSRMAVGALY